jgi:hypothetical protein
MQAAKQRMQGATEEGIQYARLNAARTAGQILARNVEHHVREARHESDVVDASEYRDEIKASIKKWAFQVRGLGSSFLVWCFTGSALEVITCLELNVHKQQLEWSSLCVYVASQSLN